MQSDVGLRQLDILEEERVDLGRVVVGHVDLFPHRQYIDQLVERGVYVEFDNIGEPSLRGRYEDRLVDVVADLLDRGLAERLLLSHDVCKRHQLAFFGGGGYTYLAGTFLPRLSARGVSPELISHRHRREPRAPAIDPLTHPRGGAMPLEYVERLEAILQSLHARESENVSRAADAMSDTIASDGFVHLFGSGHSVIRSWRSSLATAASWASTR